MHQLCSQRFACQSNRHSPQMTPESCNCTSPGVLECWSAAPASMVPSLASCLLRCLGSFWQGAYSTVALYCEPRSEMKGSPFRAKLHLVSSAWSWNAKKAKLVVVCRVLHRYTESGLGEL